MTAGHRLYYDGLAKKKVKKGTAWSASSAWPAGMAARGNCEARQHRRKRQTIGKARQNETAPNYEMARRDDQQNRRCLFVSWGASASAEHTPMSSSVFLVTPTRQCLPSLSLAGLQEAGHRTLCCTANRVSSWGCIKEIHLYGVQVHGVQKKSVFAKVPVVLPSAGVVSFSLA